MAKEVEYGNNYGSSSSLYIYKANISEYENLLTIFLETPELKERAIELLSDSFVFEQLFEAALGQQHIKDEYVQTSYSKFKSFNDLKDCTNLGEVEVTFNYSPQHAIQFILHHHKLFDDKIIQKIVEVKFDNEKKLLNYLNLTELKEIKQFPKVIITMLKNNHSWLDSKALKFK